MVVAENLSRSGKRVLAELSGCLNLAQYIQVADQVDGAAAPQVQRDLDALPMSTAELPP
jgi:hypothetical protein